jgi:SAM-dependent methyltransferase
MHKLTNGAHYAQNELRKAIQNYAHYITGKTLDAGCGKKPYKRLFDCGEYVGLDFEGAHDHSNEEIDVLYDGHTFPFANGEFDSVVCTQALEHVNNPARFVGEIHRVLKSGGILLLSVPFIWGEHEKPHDYTRYTSFGLKHLLELTGFDVLEQCKTLHDVRAIYQLKNFFLFTKAHTRKNPVSKYCDALRMLCNNVMGAVSYAVNKQHSDLFIDNVVVCRKLPQ